MYFLYNLRRLIENQGNDDGKIKILTTKEELGIIAKEVFMKLKILKKTC